MARPIGVEVSHRLVKRNELDPKRPEFVERPGEVRDGTGKAIEPEDHDSVEAPPSRVRPKSSAHTRFSVSGASKICSARRGGRRFVLRGRFSPSERYTRRTRL
jgi:hypothetical protein